MDPIAKRLPLRAMLPFLLLLPALQGCGGREEEEPPPPPARQTQIAAAPAPAPAAKPEPGAAEREGPDEVLRRYYSLIERGRYAEGWGMRSASKAGAVEFARNFAAYESYRVTVGTPSEAVEAGGWAFAEVPIMITGRMKGGEPFGSAGSVSMRKAAGAAGASARERSWHIYTGE